MGFPMNTVSTPPVPTMEILTYNWKESMSTTTKPPVVDMSQEPSLWTWNQVLWTLLELDHSVNCSDQTTSSSVKPVLVTTGLKVVTAYKVSRSATLLEVVPVLVWEPF